MVMTELKSLAFENHYLVSPLTPGSGGLALLWKSDINIQINETSCNYIDTEITYKGTSFSSLFVYGAPEQSNRQGVWDSLSRLRADRDNPWILMGDFNEITDNSEKAGGRERPESTFNAFRSFLSSCDLFDLKHTGDFLSWRGQRHSHLVHCRLDRTLVNSSWSDLFPNGRAHYLPFEASDHRPLLTTFDSKQKKKAGIFRYDRRLRNNEEIRVLVEAAWQANSNLPVANRISSCRKAIVKWSKQFYINSQQKISELGKELDLAMAARNTDT